MAKEETKAHVKEAESIRRQNMRVGCLTKSLIGTLALFFLTISLICFFEGLTFWKSFLGGGFFLIISLVLFYIAGKGEIPFSSALVGTAKAQKNITDIDSKMKTDESLPLTSAGKGAISILESGFVFTYKPTKTPSLKAVILTLLTYLLGSLAIVVVILFNVGVHGVAFGISIEKLESFVGAITHITSFFFFLIMTIFLVKRYSGYLFSGSWKINLYSHLKTGLMWSIPFIILTGIIVLIPEARAESLNFYLLENNLSWENITIMIVILISAETLIVSFLEELIFRGMIQQYISKFVTPVISILITAGIFTLAHFGKFFFLPVSLGNVGYWFIAGIFTGFAFNKTKSCISSFIPHLVGNLKQIIIVPLMLTF